MFINMAPPIARDRGQSSVLGYALVVGIVALAVVSTLALGAAALEDTRTDSEVARAEQTMTLFDSQAAQVALGESSAQTVDLGRSDGTYTLDEMAGEISIVQLDCDDDGDNGGADYDGATGALGADDAYILSPQPLGKLVYETGDQTLAYQGGGVWKGSGEGARMISPPEFHYRGATLTLPVVLTRGDGGASGATKARVRSTTNAVPVYPNSSDSFPTSSPDCDEDGVTEPFKNPVADGTVIVRVESEYARAWGEYFATRTAGDVRYPADGVVVIELVSLKPLNDFAMPGDGGSVTVAGASGDHSTNGFTITLTPDSSDSARFNNLQWSMYVKEGNQEMEIYLKKGSGGDADCSDGTTDLQVDVTIYYSPDGGSTYYGWHGDDAFSAECENYDQSDAEDEIKLVADFVDDEDGDDTQPSGGGPFTSSTDIEEVSQVDVDRGDPKLEYVDKSGMNNLVHFGINGGATAPSSYIISGHGGSDPWEPTASFTPNDGDTVTVDRIVNHYFAELPAEFELTVDDKGSDTVQESASSGYLNAGSGNRYVTYLHVTRNEIEVEIE